MAGIETRQIGPQRRAILGQLRHWPIGHRAAYHDRLTGLGDQPPERRRIGQRFAVDLGGLRTHAASPLNRSLRRRARKGTWRTELVCA